MAITPSSLLKRLASLLKRLASFKLAIFAMAGMGLLIFVMTLAQVKLGIFAAKKAYFDTWFLWGSFGGVEFPYFLGGKTFGVLMLLNMTAATLRIPLKKNKIGLWLIHLSTIVLLAGSGWIALVANESQMAVEEGQTAWYSESIREFEMVILSDAKDGKETVVSIPEHLLKENAQIAHTAFPFEIDVLRVYPNSRIEMAMPGMENKDPLKATAGMGPQLSIKPQPVVSRDDYRNLMSVWVQLRQGNKVMGIWVLSNGLGAPQTVLVDNTVYRLQLRPLRYYNDYGISLKDFRREMHPGTTIPSHFSSLVDVLSDSGEHLQSALIEMNHPLRFKGKTYFQASYGKDDTLTIFQVVENPGWLLPYVSCLGILVGMVWHFGVRLVQQRRKDKA